MSIANDFYFIKQLKQYLNDSDVDNIITSFSKPIEGININRRTGRVMVGVPSRKYRKALTNGSLVNYKSVLLKFAKFKASKIGKYSPIDVDIMQQYNSEILTNGDKNIKLF